MQVTLVGASWDVVAGFRTFKPLFKFKTVCPTAVEEQRSLTTLLLLSAHSQSIRAY